MTTLDLRSEDEEADRDRLFDALDEADADETITVEAGRDLTVLLTRYRITRGRDLDVTTEHHVDGVVEHAVTKAAAHEGDELTEFDVRDVPPSRRHEALTGTFDRLDPGQGFELVNDHDPKPLYHELRSTRGESFEWEYTRRDPGEWRVEIRKTGETESGDGAVTASFDVREIPKQERHPTIHHRYGNIDEGETMEIVAPHEPVPLRREFEQRYGEAFDWSVIETEPGRCRVHVTKGGESGSSTDDDRAASSGDASVTVAEELDVRELPPAQRHERIFDTYGDLETGEGFVLVNDHDPKPLYHQFEAEAGDEFHWEYRAKDPGEFRVLIGRESGDGATAVDDDVPSAPF
ncbi:DUF2249 domain-containing protein [Halobaculum sp. WSA2]|uniref:DUF2249 domain-containing protein n=1 Tax=Halobaculum saliterrae TaxID=2073113 RepID=A0A6B0STP3_9EURY|nr:DUF2249 domain-containing protein [Halobaculum saliterrae]MXR42254.1 DUF2249 domain-containing protein [Halobaculum saliterrae]